MKQKTPSAYLHMILSSNERGRNECVICVPVLKESIFWLSLFLMAVKQQFSYTDFSCNVVQNCTPQVHAKDIIFVMITWCYFWFFSKASLWNVHLIRKVTTVNISWAHSSNEKHKNMSTCFFIVITPTILLTGFILNNNAWIVLKDCMISFNKKFWDSQQTQFIWLTVFLDVSLVKHHSKHFLEIHQISRCTPQKPSVEAFLPWDNAFWDHKLQKNYSVNLESYAHNECIFIFPLNKHILNI